MTSVGRTGRSMPLIPGGINLAALDNAIEQVEFEQFMEDGDAQNHEEPRSPTSVASAGSAGNGVHELAIFKPGNESEKSAGKDSNASATTLTTSSIITGMRKMSLAAIETRSPLVSSSPPPPRVSEEEEEDFMVAPKMPVSKAPRLKIFIENNMEAILAFGTDSMVKGPVRMASSLKLEGAAHVPNSTPAPSGPAALSMPQIPLITNFITGNFKTIIGNSRKDQLDRHVTGTANHLLQRPLPSPFDEVYRADTLTLIIRKFHVPKNVAVKSNFITNKPEGDVVKNAQVTLKIRNLELKTPLIEELPLDQDIKIRFQFPVSYHAILFDHIILVLKHDDLIQSRTRVPLAMMRPMELDAASRLKGTLPIKMKSYEDYKNVKSTRKGNLGMTQAIRLDDFGTATVDWAFSYTGEQALENRKGPLGEKGFWHISDVEKWLLDGVEPPHDVMPKSAAGKAGPTTSPRDSTHESDAGSPSISPKMSFGNLAKGAEDSPTTTSALPGPVSATSAAEIVEDPRKRVLKRSTDSTAALSREQSVSSISTLPQSPSSGSFGSTRKVGRSATTTGAKKALIKSTADSSDPHRGFVRVQTIVGEKTDDAEESEKELPSGTLPRAKKDSDSPTEESHHKKAKQAKALGEIEPVWKGLQSGIRLNLRSVKFLVSAFQTVRKMLVQAPEPPYVDRDVRRQAVRMDRVREARWWLKFSVAAYEQSSAAPFLLPKHARKANIGMVSRFLGINEQEMLWWQEQEGSFTSKFFVCWIAEKKSLVIAVRGTAGVQEALADLNGEYIPFRKGVSHKGFVLSATYIYNKQRQNILDWATKYSPKRIVCTGHSYGGSVASILSILLRDDLDLIRDLAGNPATEIQAITFGAAPTISAELRSETLHIDSYVNYMDPVPCLCYGTMLDLRELLIEADALIEDGLKESEILAKLSQVHQRLAKSSLLKLEVAGNIWFLREAPAKKDKNGGDDKSSREAREERELRPPKGPSFWDRLLGRASTDSSSAPTASAAFDGLFLTNDTYIVEPQPPTILFELHGHPDSMAKPHTCAFYGTALKSVVTTHNSG